MCGGEYNGNVEKESLLTTSAGDADTKKSGTTAWTEARLLLELAVPTAVVQLGFTVPPFSIASYVGINYGYIYLDGMTLANLTGNLCTLALLQGLYSASDTLSPQAFGAGNEREVGLLAMRGFLGSMFIIIPMNLGLFFFLRPIMIYVGEDPEASTIAWHWYQIYSLTLPFYALYMVTWKFLSAQNVMMPLVVSIAISCAVVLPVTLQYFPRWFGFLGTAWCIVAFQVFESSFLLFLLWWKQPHVAATWPGLSAWREALKWKPFTEYMTLGLGGMIASSEWIYWEALALVIGTLGVVPLSVHTIPTQVIMVAFMIPLGVGIALAVRLGATLSQSGGVRRAKELVVGCYVVGTIVFGIIAVIMYVARQHIFGIFTTNPQVLSGCEMIWWKVCLYFFNLAVFGISMGTATGLGMQWTLGLVTIVFLWVMGMPAAYYFAVVRGGGLNVAWSWIVPPYMCINVTLMVTFVLKDWNAIANGIRLREGITRHEIDIEELALVEETHNGTQSQSHSHSTGNRGYGATETHDGEEDNFYDAVSD